MAGFHDIIGHEKIKEHLQKAIGYQRVSHAYILSGEEGMGRKTIAKAFAMTLLCEKHGTEPCMECHSCKQFLSGNHPDVIWVTHEKPASIGVDDVRIQINDTVSIRPYSSPYKIYLVDEAEKMTVQAQNALLKTIEEPPAYAVLVLITTNPEVFLPTILSRCIQLKLRPLKDSVVSDYLTEKMGVSDGQADIYSAKKKVKIYYTNETGDKLIPYLTELTVTDNVPLETQVLLALKNPPASKKNLKSPLPSDFYVNQTQILNNICYVDLSSEVEKAAVNVKEKVTVYAMVNSLTDLDTAYQVQFTIDGKKISKLNEFENFDALLTSDFSLCK